MLMCLGVLLSAVVQKFRKGFLCQERASERDREIISRGPRLASVL